MPDFTLPFKQSVPVSGTSFEINNVAAIPNPVVGGNPLEPVPPTLIASSLAGVGVSGQSGTDSGVSGQSDSNSSAGVVGINTGGGPGISGSSTAFDAVVGTTASDAHAGVTGRNTTNGKNGGVGVYGTGGEYAGKFDGNVLVNGTVTVTTDIVLTGADCAEEFDIATDVDIGPGTVMVLGDTGTLRASDQAYDRKVVGVISGAGEYKPGLVLDKSNSSERRLPLALVGKVYCKVDAQRGAIEVGDLLTTSACKGHAMKAEDPAKAFGSIIGKALKSLPAGQGIIPIMVSLR